MGLCISGVRLGRSLRRGRGLIAQLRLGRVHRVQSRVVDHLTEARLILLDLQLQTDSPASLVGLDGRLAGSLRESVVVVCVLGV